MTYYAFSKHDYINQGIDKVFTHLLNILYKIIGCGLIGKRKEKYLNM